MKTLQEVMKVIRAKNNGHIDYRTVIGKVCKQYNKNMEVVTSVNYDQNNNTEYTTDKQVFDPDLDGDDDSNESTDIDNDSITEELSRRVRDGGDTVTKDEDEEGRARRARKNSSLSKTERNRISRKAARTRNLRQSDINKSKDKREKSIDKKERLGISEMKTFEELMEGPIDWFFKKLHGYLQQRSYDNLEVEYDHGIRRNLLDNPDQFKDVSTPPEDAQDLLLASAYMKYKKEGKDLHDFFHLEPSILKYIGMTDEQWSANRLKHFERVKEKYNLPD
jgi:hypothetical protein